jgi:hypothetical protein
VWSGKTRKVSPKDITSLAPKVCQEDASDLREPFPQRPRGLPLLTLQSALRLSSTSSLSSSLLHQYTYLLRHQG